VTTLDPFLSAAPQPQRAGIKVLVALARRPGGARLLGRAGGPAGQLAYGLLAMEHFEDPANARKLGWDADAVAARGRVLRRTEGRP
jgi:hypothetical protein